MPGGDYDESRGGAGLRDTAGRGSPQAGRALVVGAGVGGLAAAWWLATAGWAVEVVERAPAARTGGFVVDLFGAGYATAERMGLAGALRAAAQPVDGFAYVTEAGRRRSGLPPAAYRRALNGRIVSVLRTDLIDILAAALPPAVRIRYGEAAVAVTDDGSGVRIQLAGGARLTGD
ncbi:MAG TPA: FAD-dependent monooxygenase, partial [Pilimelia sp.]|nr:FAD-dependent monooxygenase [Pilimelia sp.]